MIDALQLPEEARELEKELRQITKEKNEVVRGQDIEKVLCFLLQIEKCMGQLGWIAGRK